jgi:hypothetical protein
VLRNGACGFSEGFVERKPIPVNSLASSATNAGNGALGPAFKIVRSHADMGTTMRYLACSDEAAAAAILALDDRRAA